MVSHYAVSLLSITDHDAVFSQSDWDEIYGYLADMNLELAIQQPCVSHALDVAFPAKTNNDPDSPMFQEAITGEYENEYWEAMDKEIAGLDKRNTWTSIPRSSIGKEYPKGPVLPSTWALKIKRKVDFSFRKFKARFCVRGDVQKRVTSEPMNTYAPVVQWSTVRLMLIMTCILKLHTVSIDFSNAFAQADIPEGTHVYIECPKGYEPANGKDMVLKLNKSLYGQAEAPRLWYKKLKNGLRDRGFTMSKVDPCLFFSKKVIVLSYVDDCLIFAKHEKDIQALIKSFQDDGNEYNWEMTVEKGGISEHLGIKILNLPEGAYKLTQPGLIKRILDTTKMSTCNTKMTPTKVVAPLGTDPNGQPPKREWNYATVVGMLLFLASHSRPDISFAVHQCARFTHCTKASHEEAVLRICRYLKGTQDQGLILKPSDLLKVDCFVDADFAGLWGAEDPQDPICAKSRTGYVITFADCPLHWVSKLQSEIALSTLHAEYVALSQSLRDLLPLKALVKEVVKNLKLSKNLSFITKSTVFEDNQGAITVAQSPRLTPTSKHIAVKYHWFRDHIGKDFDIEHVESEQQVADLFTKGLQGSQFLNI